VRIREESEIIEGEVVEIELDKPETGGPSKTVPHLLLVPLFIGVRVGEVDDQDDRHGDALRFRT